MGQGFITQLRGRRRRQQRVDQLADAISSLLLEHPDQDLAAILEVGISESFKPLIGDALALLVHEGALELAHRKVA